MYLDEQANARFKNVSPLSSFGIFDDLSTVATAVSQLNGIVSDETLLSILPFVDNPKEEAEKVKDQKQSQMDIYSNAFVTGDKDGEEEE